MITTGYKSYWGNNVSRIGTLYKSLNFKIRTLIWAKSKKIKSSETNAKFQEEIKNTKYFKNLVSVLILYFLFTGYLFDHSQLLSPNYINQCW